MDTRKSKSFNCAGQLHGDVRSIKFGVNFNSRPARPQTVENFRARVADAGDESQACDDDASHGEPGFGGFAARSAITFSVINAMVSSIDFKLCNSGSVNVISNASCRSRTTSKSV